VPTLADIVRTDCDQLRPAAPDTPQAEAIKAVARAHNSRVGERACHVQRLRQARWEYFPAAVNASDDLSAPDASELLGKAADPVEPVTVAACSAALACYTDAAMVDAYARSPDPSASRSPVR